MGKEGFSRVKTGFAKVDGWPVLGSLVPLSRNALELFTRLLWEHGDRVRLRVPGRSILLLADPQDIEAVLVRDRASFEEFARTTDSRPAPKSAEVPLLSGGAGSRPVLAFEEFARTTDSRPAPKSAEVPLLSGGAGSRPVLTYSRSAEVMKLRPIFGRGLLASEGELWQRQRALIQPEFQHRALDKYARIMQGTIERQLDGWRSGETRDMQAEMMSYTRETIWRVLFGERLPAEPNDLGDAVTTVFGDLRSEILYLAAWRLLPLRRSRNWNRSVKLLNAAIGGKIRQRRESGGEADDLLGGLLRARGSDGKGMPDEQVHDEILTFFLAGHETAALSLTWAAYLLARHPEMQAEIRREAAEISAAGELSAEDCGKLRFTQAVVKESLRLYPPVWSLGRRALADTTLNGEKVAKGTDIWICVHRLHHDERWFDEPEWFQPGRWLDGQAAKPFTYLPFGMGQRVCIGQHFATMEAVLGLATVLRRFRLELTSEVAVEPNAWITLRPKWPIRLRVV